MTDFASLIVPDRGAAIDQLAPGAGVVYRSASEVSLERAIGRFIDRGPELQRAAAIRAVRVRTMDEHFSELFARYGDLLPQHHHQLSRPGFPLGEVALARSVAGS